MFTETYSGGLSCGRREFDLGIGQCLDTNINSDVYGFRGPTGNYMDTYNDTRIAYIGLDGTNSVSSTSRTPPTVRPTTYFLTQAGQWAAKFSYGTVKGSSVCTAGYSGKYSGGATTNENLTSTSTGSGTCWCKMTSPATSYWASLGYETSCYAMCASQCADYVGAFDTMRATMYGTVGN